MEKLFCAYNAAITIAGETMTCPTRAQTTDDGFYKRPLPAAQIPFSSVEGRQIFQEALLAGSMQNFFPLAEQFHTQTEPTFCGISSLVMVLNALQVDPKRLWKGVWRWFSEDMADCCQQLGVITQEGITLTRLATLARCNGLDATVVHADAKIDALGLFRQQVVDVSTRLTPDGSLEQALLVSYSRASLGQTGSGHFSPIGGYHAARDLVLLLDVARFKYPPHWVALPLLWQAMQTRDEDTGLARGYLHLQPALSDQASPDMALCPV